VSELRANFFRHVAQTSESPIGLEIVRAEGSWLYNREGRRFLDFISGIGVANLGHSNPIVLEAIRAQAGRHLHVMVYGEYVLESQVRLAQRIAGLLPAAVSRIYFTNSGAEAIEGALKVARKFTGRSSFVAFDGAYHGDTMAALALAGNAAFRAPFEPLPGPVRHLPYDDITALSEIDREVAAVVIEPVQAEGGVRIPSRDFVVSLSRRCREMGALLIFDEVLTGFGRTGKLFAMEHFGVVPDLIVMAKALGGGLPLGAFCGSDETMATLARNPPLGHITTFGGHPLSCAAALAAIEVMIEGRLWERAASIGGDLYQRLENLSMPPITAVRGIGMLLGLEFSSAAAAQRFCSEALKRGVIVNWTLNADRVVRLAPPLTIGVEEVDFALDAIAGSLEATGQMSAEQ
jgi:acetylornithine/N-succinyldiaminopimelate aminotransferase